MEGYVMRKYQVPEFESWNFCNEMPITQYFQSAKEAGLIKAHFFGGDGDGQDLFKVLSPYHHHHHHHLHRHHQHQHQHQQYSRKVLKERVNKGEKMCYNNEKRKKPKAVDEDLYKIPPHLLPQMPRKKKLMRSFWTGCLSINCIAE